MILNAATRDGPDSLEFFLRPSGLPDGQSTEAAMAAAI
jgi:hypothetical protein